MKPAKILLHSPFPLCILISSIFLPLSGCKNAESILRRVAGRPLSPVIKSFCHLASWAGHWRNLWCLGWLYNWSCLVCSQRMSIVLLYISLKKFFDCSFQSQLSRIFRRLAFPIHEPFASRLAHIPRCWWFILSPCDQHCATPFICLELRRWVTNTASRVFPQPTHSRRFYVLFTSCHHMIAEHSLLSVSSARWCALRDPSRGGNFPVARSCVGGRRSFSLLSSPFAVIFQHFS